MSRTRAPLLALLAASLLLAPSAARGQKVMGGTPGVGIHVVDPSDAPIPGARVAVVGTGTEGVSDETGWVRLRGLRAGRIAVRVTRLGYAPTEFALQVPSTGMVEVDVEMAPGPVALEGVTAVGAAESRSLGAAGFYRRRKTGRGTFLTRRDIEKSGALRTSEVFRRVRGVRVVPGGRSGYKLQSVRYGASLSRTPHTGGTRTAPGGGSGGSGGSVCEMVVFLDGVQVQLEGIDEVGLQNIEAIEVYGGPSDVPAEYNLTNTSCGLVLLWTRTGA